MGYTVKHCLILLVVSINASAQVMATIGPIPLESVGLPSQPPLLTLIGMANPGKWATDPSISPKGAAVSEVFHEELRGATTPAGAAGSVEASVRTKFDEQGRIVEKIESRWNNETDTIYTYREGRLVRMESTLPNVKKPEPAAWNDWSYDSRGKLTEFRRGSGTALQNHEVNFKYDAKGRLLGFDFRQGADDKPFSHTEVSYSNDGNRVIVTTAFAGSTIIDRSTRTLDDQGRVVRVVLDSEGRAKTEQASKVDFRYDAQGRLVEQTTDATEFSKSGAEHDLPPGTISVTYDDKNRTKTTKYSSPSEGSLEIVVTQDEGGAATGFAMKLPPNELSSRLECQYDHLGNWTSCRQIAKNQGHSNLKQEFRRVITYR